MSTAQKGTTDIIYFLSYYTKTFSSELLAPSLTKNGICSRGTFTTISAQPLTVSLVQVLRHNEPLGRYTALKIFTSFSTGATS